MWSGLAGESYRRHQWSTLETTTDSVVDSLWFSPCCLDSLESVRLMADERRASLLDDFLTVSTGDGREDTM